jgi:hypothetical protein
MTEATARHCVSVYDYMKENCELAEEGFDVYNRSLTAIFDNLKISRTFYSDVWNALEQGGYVTRQGPRSSSVLLHSRPDYEMLLTTIPTPATVPLVRRIEAIEALELERVLKQLSDRITIMESAHKGNNEGENTE